MVQVTRFIESHLITIQLVVAIAYAAARIILSS